MRERTILDSEAMAVKEAFFSAGQDILRPVKTMIGDTYPLAQREKISSHFNPAVLDEYDKTIKRANNVLYEQRNLVQSKWLLRYDVRRSKDRGPDWNELHEVLDAALDRMSELLIANSPLLVRKEYVEQLQAAVEKATEAAKHRLTKYLESFNVKRKAGVVKLEEEYD